MPSPIRVFATVSPEEFKYRTDIIQQVCAQLDHTEIRSTALVGGPFTGQTSLLRFMTSNQAHTNFPSLARTWNVYISGDAIGLTTTPSHFWASVFREIQRQVDPTPLEYMVSDMVEKTKNDQFDIFNLEDFFDTCANKGRTVVLFINNFLNLLRNANFWPPNSFFHHVRSLAQRSPRGLSFVVGTPRPLSQLWDPSKNASPFYNIFLSVPIGRLTGQEVREIVHDRFTSLKLQFNEDIETLVLDASARHPSLVNYITDMCAQMIKTNGQIEINKLYEAFGDPAGPVVMLIRQIREHLSHNERQMVDMAKDKPQNLSEVQISQLRKLWEYGLVPPGVSIP